MNVPLYKDYWLTSATGDLCFTLERRKISNKKESKSYGEEVKTTICYPTTIEYAISEMCMRELYNCKATTLEGVIKEVKKLQVMIEELANYIGMDDITKNIRVCSEQTLSLGDIKNNAKPKQVRKKKGE